MGLPTDIMDALNTLKLKITQNGFKWPQHHKWMDK